MKSLQVFLTETCTASAAQNHPVNMIGASKERVLSHFKALKNMHHKLGKSIEDEFYAGITCDIPSNLSRHGINEYLGCVVVDSYETASHIEELLHTELGFYIGEYEEGSAGRGGNEETTIVYLARRDQPGFKD